MRPEQWAWPTPCPEWDVRALVNHVVRGTMNCTALARGGNAAEFIAMFSADALGDDPAGAFAKASRECADVYTAPEVLDGILDFPLGPAKGKQVLAVRTADTLIHTWDLARSLRIDEVLDPGLVKWLGDGADAIFAGLAETPSSAKTSHRLFSPPPAAHPGPESPQDQVLRHTGRDPGAA